MAIQTEVIVDGHQICGTMAEAVTALGREPIVLGDTSLRGNSAAEVRAETERAFQLSFVSMWGNIKVLVGSICTVVVFTLLSVTVSTMSMAIRERFRELAVLKALGYKRRELFAFILAESFGLAMLGGLAGAGGAWVLIPSTCRNYPTGYSSTSK